MEDQKAKYFINILILPKLKTENMVKYLPTKKTFCHKILFGKLCILFSECPLHFANYKNENYVQVIENKLVSKLNTPYVLRQLILDKVQNLI